MNNRFKFRLPFYNNDGEFSHFQYFDIVDGLKPYNAGVMFHRHEYEQCTELKDKNGNLIYENDQFYDSNKRLCTVSWYSGAFHNGFGNLLGNFRTDEIEIIGNIHEQAKQKDNK